MESVGWSVALTTALYPADIVRRCEGMRAHDLTGQRLGDETRRSMQSACSVYWAFRIGPCNEYPSELMPYLLWMERDLLGVESNPG